MEDNRKNALICVLGIALLIAGFAFTIIIIVDNMKTTCYDELTVFKEYYYNEGNNDAVEFVYNTLITCEAVPVKFNNETIYAINYDCLREE